MPEEATGADSLLTADAQPATTSEWYTPDYKDVVEKKGWASPVDALKSYTELERAFSSRVKMPTPESSAEEIRAFYQKTGCPENPDGYEIQVPEEIAPLRDEATEVALKQVAYEMGVSKQAFEAIANRYYQSMVDSMVKAREQGEAQLKEELGDKYDESIKVAQRFAQNTSEEFRQLLETTGLGNNPVFIKEFINLGKKTLSDSLIKGEPATDEEWKPTYPDSPEMYRNGDDEESVKAREWFARVKGYTY